MTVFHVSGWVMLAVIPWAIAAFRLGALFGVWTAARELRKVNDAYEATVRR